MHLKMYMLRIHNCLTLAFLLFFFNCFTKKYIALLFIYTLYDIKTKLICSYLSGSTNINYIFYSIYLIVLIINLNEDFSIINVNLYYYVF